MEHVVTKPRANGRSGAYRGGAVKSRYCDGIQT